MKHIFFQILTLSLAAVSLAQTTRSPLSNQYTGATAYGRKLTDVFSFSGNQAALANIQSTAAGVYNERRFNLAELSSYHVVAATPLQNAGIGMNMHYAGYDQFSEMQAGLAYGLKLFKNISLGAQVNYNHVRIAGYGAATAVNFELGVLYAVSEKVNTGFHVYNPVGGTFGKNKAEKFASVYAGGIAYEPTGQFLISAEIAKEEDKPVNVNASFQYSFIKQFLVRAGISAATANYFAGAGLTWHCLRLDVVTSYHRQLGFSPAIMLIFQSSKKTGE